MIDYKDRRPIYEQIVERYQQLILCEALEPNTPMPSVRSLAMELSINPNTIQRAYQELEKSGYIYSMKGKGSFVSDLQGISKAADSKRSEITDELSDTVQKAKSAGITKPELEEILTQVINKAFD